MAFRGWVRKLNCGRLTGRQKLAAISTLAFAHTPLAWCGSLNTLYSFSGGVQAVLIQGRDGNLYGSGADGSGGGIYKITPAGNLSWLYYDSSKTAETTTLLQTSSGDFIGAVNSGGSSGGGYLVNVDTAGSLSTIYNFPLDGSGFSSVPDGLIQGGDGNLYGTTLNGGSLSAGTFYQLAQQSNLTTLHSFTASDTNGYGPAPQSIVQNGSGEFYGLTGAGGASGAGTIYSITPSGTEKLVYSLNGSSDGVSPNSLILASDGNYYGTTVYGGNQNSGCFPYFTCGVVFKLTASGTYSTLHAFTGSDGYFPGALIEGSDGNFYGLTGVSSSVMPFENGSLFKLTPNGVLTTLYMFTDGADGAYPSALIEASDGNFYGITLRGGNTTLCRGSGCGTAFEFPGPGGPPAVPTGSNSIAGNAQVSLSWNAASGAATYNIYEGTSSGAESTAPILTGLTSTTAIVTPLANGTTYYFKIAAVNTSGISGFSNEVSATPQIPPGQVAGLTANADNAQVSLSWASTSGATAYTVYQGTASGGETPIATGVTGTSYVVIGLTNGTVYYFEVAATNSAGSGPVSAEVSATPQVSIPATPTGLGAMAGNAQVALSWTASAGANSYNIYQGASAGGENPAPVLTGITTTGVNVTGLSNGTKYYFTVKAVNAADSSAASNEASATPLAGTAATPVFSPAGGIYTSTQTISISDATVGATIFYTTDGSIPTSASTPYSGAITVSSTETLKAIATATGYISSPVTTAAYTINLPQAVAPSFSPAGGTYTSAQTVSLNDTTPGTSIYYTMDGSTPTSASTLYTGSIVVSSSQTLKAIATASGYTSSSVASATYTISIPLSPTAIPTFSPVAGAYSSAQSVTISDGTPGAAIYYTTDGSSPTTSSTTYTGAISVSASETIEAIAVAPGFTASGVASATYTINIPLSAAATPTFSPAAGTYNSTQNIAISDATPGAVIYYTTDGTTPTMSSTVYAGAISISASETLKSIAVAPGYENSGVATASYTITQASSGGSSASGGGGGGGSISPAVLALLAGAARYRRKKAAIAA